MCWGLVAGQERKRKSVLVLFHEEAFGTSREKGWAGGWRGGPGGTSGVWPRSYPMFLPPSIYPDDSSMWLGCLLGGGGLAASIGGAGELAECVS